MTTGTAQNPRRRVVALNASSGAFVTIEPTGPCRYMEIKECPPTNYLPGTNDYNPQGTIYERADEAYANTYGLLPGDVLSLGDRNWKRDRAIGIPINMTDPAGNAIGQSTTATIKMRSATTTATQVEVDEWL